MFTAVHRYALFCSLHNDVSNAQLNVVVRILDKCIKRFVVMIHSIQSGFKFDESSHIYLQRIKDLFSSNGQNFVVGRKDMHIVKSAHDIKTETHVKHYNREFDT